jgi:NTP pyrophosphatase (non-canonical NTP hydrolase)
LNTFEQYDAFVKSMKAYPEKFAIIYPALGLSGEAGEIAEKVKKWIRDDGNDATSSQISDERRHALLMELGDPLWYITSLAADLGFALQDVVDANEKKLTSRKERGVLQGSGDNR